MITQINNPLNHPFKKMVKTFYRFAIAITVPGLMLSSTASAQDRTLTLDEAIKLAGQLGDGRLCALAGLNRAYVLQAQDRILEAMIQARQALRLCRAVGDARGEAYALYTIGWHLVQCGDHQQAIKFSSRALMAYRQSPCAADSWP